MIVSDVALTDAETFSGKTRCLINRIV